MLDIADAGSPDATSNTLQPRPGPQAYTDDSTQQSNKNIKNTRKGGRKDRGRTGTPPQAAKEFFHPHQATLPLQVVTNDLRGVGSSEPPSLLSSLNPRRPWWRAPPRGWRDDSEVTNELLL